MAGSTITELSEVINPSQDDLFVVVHKVAGVDTTMKVTLNKVSSLIQSGSSVYEPTVLTFDSPQTINVSEPLPSNTLVSKIVITVLIPFNGNTPNITFGVDGAIDELGLASESYLDEAGTYIIEVNHTYLNNETIVASFESSGSTEGYARIEVHYNL